VITDVRTVQKNVTLAIRPERPDKLDAGFMASLHVPQQFDGMARNIDLVDLPMMDVAEQHQIADIALQLLRKHRIAARPIGFIRDDVRNVGGVELGLGDIVLPKRSVAPVVLAPAGRLAP